jgi:hypothetical protein
MEHTTTQNVSLSEALKIIAGKFEADLTPGYVRHFSEIINDYKAKAAAHVETPMEAVQNGAHGLCAHRACFGNRGAMGMSKVAYRMASARYQFLSHYVVTVGEYPNKRFEVVADWEARVAARAAKEAKATVAGFKAKMAKKMDGIFAGRPTTISINGTVARNWFSVEIAGVGSFRVENNVVSVWPRNAVPHHRFPTTFHAVRLANGEEMKSPSEAKVKKAFAA